jgi:pyruvate/2-oxoglutarate dehydrogenase complex dihydrolipoamide dehydrogenase (E3) component
VRVDFGAVVDRKNAIVQRWREQIRKELNAAGSHLTFLEGHARFVGEREVEVSGRRYSAKTVIINVGARPIIPALTGLESIRWLDNASLMELRSLPAHLVILGGGYIGCEFGQMFRRFGSDVTIVDRNPHLLAREDPEISTEIEKVFRGEGIRLELQSAVQQVSGGDGEIRVKLEQGREVRGSHLLVAIGRRPNTDDLDCNLAGVQLDKNGFVIVDEHYQTSAQAVYAVGDAIPQPQFTHTAWDDHRLLFDLLMNRGRRKRTERVIPYTVFTDPQVAGVGLTEKDARDRGIAYEVASMPFGQIARALEVDETAGVLKVLLDPKSERILGACIVGSEAGELIHVLSTIMQAKVSARPIVDGEYVHPTFSEGLQTLVMKLKRFSLD